MRPDLPLRGPQVHPERDSGASHHSGAKPRPASSLHHAGYGRDAEAGEPPRRRRAFVYVASVAQVPGRDGSEGKW